MPTLFIHPQTDTLKINLAGLIDSFTDEMSSELRRNNPYLRLEITNDGNIITIPSATDSLQGELTSQAFLLRGE
ncbi:MAG: hypothetical protein JST85_01680 [Acidobacteria bacterium]|nr:hypothetical protein [Acidobacteriota bacterium]